MKPLYMVFYTLLGAVSWAFFVIFVRSGVSPQDPDFKSGACYILGLTAMLCTSRLMCEFLARRSGHQNGVQAGHEETNADVDSTSRAAR